MLAACVDTRMVHEDEKTTSKLLSPCLQVETPRQLSRQQTEHGRGGFGEGRR